MEPAEPCRIFVTIGFISETISTLVLHEHPSFKAQVGQIQEDFRTPIANQKFTDIGAKREQQNEKFLKMRTIRAMQKFNLIVGLVFQTTIFSISGLQNIRAQVTAWGC